MAALPENFKQRFVSSKRKLICSRTTLFQLCCLFSFIVRQACMGAAKASLWKLSFAILPWKRLAEQEIGTLHLRWTAKRMIPMIPNQHKQAQICWTRFAKKLWCGVENRRTNHFLPSTSLTEIKWTKLVGCEQDSLERQHINQSKLQINRKQKSLSI